MSGIFSLKCHKTKLKNLFIQILPGTSQPLNLVQKIIFLIKYGEIFWKNKISFPADYFKQFEKKTIYSSKEIEALKKLDLKSNVKWSEIREQFKKLVKKYHPDTNSGDKKFENKLKDITIAYTLLRNNQKNVNHGQ